MAKIDPDQIAPAGKQRVRRYFADRTADIIVLKERFLNMLKKDLILRNPLRLMGHEADDVLQTGQFGAVLARAGVGKTAFLVQLALNKMLRGNKVLHISLEDPVNKVNLWYQEVWRHIAREYQSSQTQLLWENLIPHRFIMTFRVEGFSVPKLEERLDDLTEQGIFTPRMLIIDGLPFDDEAVEDTLEAFGRLSADRGLHAWFTMLTHRHETPGPGGIPQQLGRVDHHFNVAIQLLPREQHIEILPLKGGPADPPRRLFLDPTTMLIQPGG
jgi:hypothetical protein